MMKLAMRAGAATLALAAALASPPAKAQSPHAAGEWVFIDRAERSRCRIVLTQRIIPTWNAARAYVRGGERCHGYSRSIYAWALRGNTMGLVSREGGEIARMNEVAPGRYEGGPHVLRRTWEE